jgi:F-type H+-transporting ATPase subunit b
VLVDALAEALVDVWDRLGLRRGKQAAAADATRKTLEGELNVKLAEAEKSIAATKQAAMANVRAIAEDTARAIIERLIGSAPSDKAVAQAVADVLKR